MSFGSYGGQCIGRVMAFLYEINTQSDHWQYGGGEILRGKEVIGTYKWKGITDIPEFNFTHPDYTWMNEEYERKWFERAKYLEQFKKRPRPYFHTDFRDQKEYTSIKQVESYVSKGFAEEFLKLYKGDPEKITEADYNPIEEQIYKEAYAFLYEDKAVA